MATYGVSLEGFGENWQHHPQYSSNVSFGNFNVNENLSILWQCSDLLKKSCLWFHNILFIASTEMPVLFKNWGSVRRTGCRLQYIVALLIYSQYHSCWFPGSFGSQGFCRHAYDLLCLKFSVDYQDNLLIMYTRWLELCSLSGIEQLAVVRKYWSLIRQEWEFYNQNIL